MVSGNERQELWVVRAGAKAIHADDFLQRSVVGIGWGLTEDVLKLDRRQDIASLYARENPDLSGQSITSAANKIYSFLFDIRMGTPVLTRNSRKRQWHIGLITSEPTYDPVLMPSLPIQRRIDWIDEIPDSYLAIAGVKGRFRRPIALFSLPQDATAAVLFHLSEKQSSFLERFQAEEFLSADYAKLLEAASRRDIPPELFFEQIIHRGMYRGTRYDSTPSLDLRFSRRRAFSRKSEIEPKKEPGRRIKLFFTTNRRAKNLRANEITFLDERGDRVIHGEANVFIPDRHKIGKLEKPTWWDRVRRIPDEHFIKLLSARRLGFGGFLDGIRQGIENSSERDLLIYVHGFATGFNEGMERFGQIVHDLKFRGAPLAFSWASRNSTAHYVADKETVDWSIDHLHELLERLLPDSGAQRVHFLAHSMGNRLILATLDRVASHKCPARTSLQRSEVMMAAPDVDTGWYKQLAVRIGGIGPRYTLYASKGDWALTFSRKWNQVDRLGYIDPDIHIVDGLDSIDASDVSTSVIGHSYHADERTVLTDIYDVLKGLATDERFSIEEALNGSRKYWKFRI